MNEPAGVWKYVRGFERFSLCDWPGNPCAVIFLGGCNLRCPTCHNFDLAWNMDSLPVVPHYKIKVALAERARWLSGVTITGGEPTTVPGLAELLYEIKRLGLPVKVDSNGMRPRVLAEILRYDLADCFAVDVKGPFHKYGTLTGKGVTGAQARENMAHVFDLARAHPDRFYFRTTLVPELDRNDVDTARSYLPSGFDLILQPYAPPRRMTNALSDHEERRPVGNVVH